ncbi:CLUMA_CG013572, isoform A [Clunio marinus]|uniref:CLUMA_CG013572, isoform A n=1 Tax=Clunio marinus TaxID=568069 RepID=A0A1J1IJ95_9DIPT|nr:CLUMA_CG013572, isoform A [Clunio marinus]
MQSFYPFWRSNFRVNIISDSRKQANISHLNVSDFMNILYKTLVSKTMEISISMDIVNEMEFYFVFFPRISTNPMTAFHLQATSKYLALSLP